jgi:hypothetical protein
MKRILVYMPYLAVAYIVVRGHLHLLVVSSESISVDC